MPNKPTTLREVETARLFHDLYETLAPAYGYETRPDTKEFDPESKNGKLMIAVCKEVLTSHNTELLRKIEGMRKNYIWDNGECSICGFESESDCHYCGVYNQALQEVIDLLSKDIMQ